MKLVTLIRAYLLLLALFTVACSDDSPPIDRCKDVVCEGGECDATSGTCVNPVTCDQASDCLAGFVCDGNVCAEATSQDCRLNPCERGECDDSTGACVNASTCTPGSEEVRCLEGFRCNRAECVDEQTFCETLNCTRGVCSFEALACVDASSCEGNDALCVAGNYCDGDTCKVNVCNEDQIDCPRGVCDAATGSCVNPSSCDVSTDCLDNTLCVAGTCIAADEACNCPGNQICNYNANTLTVTCELNPAGCTNALDCKDDNVCEQSACVAPTACAADALEPNNTVAEASVYFDAENQGNIRDLTICGTDTDRFIFDTRLDADDIGTLLAEATIPTFAVGQGELTLTLIGPNGSQIATATNVKDGVQTPHVRIEHVVNNLGRGTYQLIVQGQGVNEAGIPYSLSMDVVGNEILNACASARTLVEGQSVSGVSISGASTAATTTCGVGTENVSEDIYQLTLDTAGFVTILASPQPLIDITVGIRRECARNESEIACVNDAIASGIETLGLYLEPGTYFVVVQGPGTASGGAYSLSYTVEDVVCVPNFSECANDQTVEVCNANGTGKAQLPCAEGCDSQTGTCIRPEGDTCGRPFVVPALPFTTDITWGDFANDYDPGAIGCVPNNSSTSSTSGSEAVFQITLAPNEAVVANLTRNLSNVSLYFATDCADIAGSCISGANASTTANEELIYLNETGADQTLFLVADRSALSTTTNAATLALTTRQIICVPGSAQCVLGRESQVCNSLGTAYDTSTFCEYGCNATTGLCATPLNDTCDNAQVLVPNIPVTAALTPYNSDYVTGTCPATGTTSTGLGRDIVYAMSLQQNDIVTVEVQANFNVMLWFTDTCTNNSLNTCIRRVNQTSSTTADSERLQFVAPATGDYYIVVDTVSSTISTGQFTITANVSSAVCTPGEVFGCNLNGTAIEYCTPLGIIGEYVCNGGCVNDACVAPLGDICADAIPLVGAAGQEVHAFTGLFKTHDVPSAGTYGDCTLQSAPGFDRIFRVDLQAGDIFRADITSTSTYLRYYAVSECGNTDSCFGIPHVGEDNFAYLANQPETFYFVVQYGLSNTSTINYTLDWLIESTSFQCLPGSSSCLDPTTVSRCGADGLSSELTTCPGACVAGACEVEITADVCAGATNIGTGLNFTYDPTDFSDDLTYATLFCGGTSPGRDAFFQVNMLAGELLEVSAYHETSTHYPVLSVLTDCGDLLNTCLGFIRGTSSNRQPTLTYYADSDQTVIVSIDATSSTATSRVNGSINVRDADCTPGPAVCNTDADALVACKDGQIVELPCVGGCANGACGTPSADSCFDAIPLDRTGSVTVAKAFPGTSFTTNPSIGYLNACAVGYNYTGTDLYYSVDLLQGERLQATLNGLTTAYLFLLEGCGLDSCLDHEPILRRTIDYVAPADQRVYLLVDRTTTGTTTSTVTINYTITPNSGVCVPGDFACVAPDTAQKCDVTGQLSGPLYDCPWGCDEAVGRCRVDTMANIDSCLTAPVLTENFAGFATHNTLTNEVAMTTASCVGTTTPGKDFFHAIDLDADQYVRVTMDRAAPNTSIFYLFSDCAAAEASCLGGKVTSTSANTVTLTYQAGAAPERIYLGIDTSTTTSERPVLFNVEFLTPTCTPDVTPDVCSADGTALIYCNSRGFPQEYTCAGGCDTATNRCVTPSGNSCIDPNVVTSTSVITGAFASFSNTYALPVTNACTTSKTPGNDAVYEVPLLAGQTLTASVVSTASPLEDVAIYISESCSEMPNSCVDGSDSSLLGAESVTYTATTDTSIFVVVDSYFSGLTGTFELTVNIQ